jgi:hypothetical protein
LREHDGEEEGGEIPLCAARPFRRSEGVRKKSGCCVRNDGRGEGRKGRKTKKRVSAVGAAVLRPYKENAKAGCTKIKGIHRAENARWRRDSSHPFPSCLRTSGMTGGGRDGAEEDREQKLKVESRN